MSDGISTTYRARQGRKDKAYRDAYDEWLSTLAPEERSRLRTMGLDKPHLEGAAAGFAERRARRAQHALHHQTRQAGADGCDV